MVMTNFFFYMLLNLALVIVGMTEPSPIFQWMMLELSMMSILPLLMKSGSFSNSQTSMKYFVSQSPASLWILASMLTLNTSELSMIITPALLFKLGLPPFHGWVISLMESISIKELSLVLTVQKFIPMSMSLTIFNMKVFILSVMIFMVLILTYSNSLSSMKMIMTLSSIGGTYWPLFSQNSSSVWLEFMILYSLTLFVLMNFLHLNKIFFLKEMIKESLFSKLLILIFLLSMGGIPPFSGFFIKLMLIKNMIFFSPVILGLVLSLSFLILYLYMSVFSTSLMNNCLNRLNSKPNFMTMIISMILLFPTPMIIFSLS